VRSAARIARSLGQRVRFRAWVARLRFELWRQNATLEVDAPHAVAFESAPRLRVYPGANRETAVLALRLGRGIRLGRELTIEIYAQGENLLEIGDGVEFHNNARILLRSGSISLGTRTRVRDGVLLKSDGVLEVGEAVTLGPYDAVHCSERIELEDFVGMGERVSVTDSDHAFDGVDMDFLKKPLLTSPVHVRRHTMVAIGSVVLRGAEIGANSVVAANSVVRGETYPARSLIAGNPAKAIKELKE
jgi:carbonic anhydrase/acetyltransferase-like protein (isoleucine patch superfamily)